MKIEIVAAKTVDITHLLTACTWSGSRIQVARKLEFSFVQDDRDPHVPVIEIDNGYTVKGYDDNKNLVFEGNIYKIIKDRAKSTVQVLALDHLHVMAVSKTTRKFVEMTPEDITAQMCAELGVIPGEFAQTGTPVSFIANRKTGYQIIMGAYTDAAKKLNAGKDKEDPTNKRYHLIMDGPKLNVIEKGTLIKDKETGEDYVADAAKNMSESKYQESIEKLIDQIMVVDEEGNLIEYIKDDEKIKKYSMFQDVYKQDPNKDTQVEAKDMLNKPERSGFITVLGNYAVRSSYSIIVKDSLFKGQFWVKSDTHTFTDGKYEMKLELEFENLMNEEKTEQEDKDKKKKKKKKKKSSS